MFLIIRVNGDFIPACILSPLFPVALPRAHLQGGFAAGKHAGINTMNARMRCSFRNTRASPTKSQHIVLSRWEFPQCCTMVSQTFAGTNPQKYQCLHGKRSFRGFVPEKICKITCGACGLTRYYTSAKSSSRGTECHRVRDERSLQDLRSWRKIHWQSCDVAAIRGLFMRTCQKGGEGHPPVHRV